MEKLVISKSVAAAGLLALTLNANDVDISKLPPPAQKEIHFKADIKPIIDASCWDCHGATERPKSRYSMDNRENSIKGGSSKEAAIIPGNSAKSPLIHMVAHLLQDLEMPPLDDDKYKPLSREQISLLRAWIDQGAKWEE
jgi:hypothetical protein